MLSQQTNDKAQSGIGILIIFIAIVVVAAIGATVLINTSESFQERGEQTADEAESEVSNKLVNYKNILVTDSTPEVTNIEVKVRKNAGSGDIDLGDMTIEYLAAGNQNTLTSDNFTITTANGDSDDVLESQSERATIDIDLDGDSTLSNLSGEDNVEMVLVTESGAETVVDFSVPDNPDADAEISPA